ncbi:MAG: hypothetical protein OEY03_06835 [Rhizobacter sp.]|nr:hypothetical protein [Rhizobacter sp.]
MPRPAAIWPIAALLAAALPGFAAPAAGRYDARLCVTQSAAAASCGAVTVDIRAAGVAQVRVSDIVYDLRLHSSQVDVVLKHGPMQIDWFTANYEWLGDELRFIDLAKRVGYQLQIGARRPDAK